MLTIPHEYELLNGPLEARGNVLLRGEVRILKVYRRRRSRWRELLARFSHRFLEGKRSPVPAARRETERRSLTLWAGHGFQVPSCSEGDPPPWIGDAPFLWLGDVTGESLYDVLLDPDVAVAQKEALVDAAAREDRRRHRLALELGEPLLLHEHPTTKHRLVLGSGELVTIDLEGGYRPDFPVPLAVIYELIGTLRSLWHHADTPCFEEPWPRRYVEAYDDLELLRELCAAAERSFRWRWKRFWNHDPRPRSKLAVLTELGARVG